MASYDYLWWNNSQLHKDGGCRATSREAPVHARVCVHVLFVSM